MKSISQKPLNTSPPVELGDVSPFKKAILEGKLPQHYLNRLATIRSFPDEVPERLVGPWNNLNWPLMKCRKIALTGIRVALNGLLEHGFVQDDQISAAIQNFLQHKFGDRITSQDIQSMNYILDLTINHICSIYQLEKPVIDYGALLQSERAKHGLNPGQLAPDPGMDE